MTREPREIELKFLARPGQGPEILAWLAEDRTLHARRLAATYFDTPGQRLREGGYVLRVREEDGRLIQTVKSRAAPDGRFGRGEWECEVAAPHPDLDALRRTPAGERLADGGADESAAGDASLAPVFKVEVWRQSVEIDGPAGVVEASLDRGRVTAAGRAAGVNEIELELQSGDPAALFATARRLTDRFGLCLSVVSKAERGFALANGGDGAPSAARFEIPSLSPAMTAGEGFQVMARASLDQVLRNAEALRAGPTEAAIHQMRVGARRLRATLTTFRRVVRDERWVELRRGLKWLGRELDPARNLDVFIEGAWRRAAADQPEHETAEGRGRLEAQRAAAHERARQAAASPTFAALALEMTAWIETGPWTGETARGARRRDRPLARFAAAALDRGRRRLAREGGRLVQLDPAARHHVRIRAKGLRYAADVFAQLFDEHPRRSRRFLGALEDLLDTLGDLNDIATGRAIAWNLAGGVTLMANETARERRLIEDAQAHYRRLRDAKPYWM